MNIGEKLVKIGENEQLVANANAELEEALYSTSEGGKSWYDAFWDAYQQNGTRTAYGYAFHDWHSDCFKPKYDLKPTRADYMFYDCFELTKKTQSLKHILEDCGAMLDTSNCTNFSYMFYYAWINEVGIIDATAASSVNNIFNYANRLVTVEKLILKEDGSQTASGAFAGATQLKNIRIEGVIGTPFDFRNCPLSKESIMSVVNALSSSVTGQIVTFNKTTKEAAFTTEEWQALIGTKSNWTISLV